MEINTIKTMPSVIGIRYPQPGSKLIATRALAAAGGWSVFVRDIKIKTIVMVMTIITILLPKILQAIRPIVVESICPPMTCLGWDRGPLCAANTRIQLAPNGPIAIG